MRLNDTRYLSRKFRRQNGHLFLIPPLQALEIADDKLLFNQFLRQNGFSEHVPERCSEDSFPFVLKKRTDEGGIHTQIISNREEAHAVEPLIGREDYFTQGYVPGDTEFTDHILFADGEVAHACTIVFNMNRELYVRGTQMQPYTNVQMSVIPPEYLDVFVSILRCLNFSGMCCFNYKVLNGVPIIFELNPRIGGSAHLDINKFLDAMTSALKPKPSMLENLMKAVLKKK